MALVSFVKRCSTSTDWHIATVLLNHKKCIERMAITSRTLRCKLIKNSLIIAKEKKPKKKHLNFIIKTKTVICDSNINSIVT